MYEDTCEKHKVAKDKGIVDQAREVATNITVANVEFHCLRAATSSEASDEVWLRQNVQKAQDLTKKFALKPVQLNKILYTKYISMLNMTYVDED